VALRIFDVIEKDRLEENIRSTGEFLKAELQRIAAAHPAVIKAVRGLGFILGLELGDKGSIPAFRDSDKAVSLQLVNRLHDAGMLTIPSGTQVIRLLPAYNLSRHEASEAVAIIERTVESLG
jgi:4-aminobutyrate aminotransferase-like enzyme